MPGSSASGAHILAIDVGTSGPKVALFQGNGRLVGAACRDTPLRLLAGGGAEQSPDDWWTAIVAASRELATRYPELMSRVAAVSVTAQWSGTVAVGHDLRPLRPAILWMDTRGAAAVAKEFGGFPRLFGYNAARLWQWLRLTGGIPGASGKDSLAHILWLRQAEPEVFARTRFFLEPKDYLNLRLTGQVAASFDSMTLHWITDNRNPHRIAYAQPLLDALGLERRLFPDLMDATDILGKILPEVARALGLPTTALVVGGSPDLQAAAVGSGALDDGQAHLYIGTSSWLTCHTPRRKTDVFHNMAALPSAIKGRYLVACEQETAGACLKWLRDAVFFPQPAAREGAFEIMLSEAAAINPGADGLLFTPWLYGERTPVEDHSLRGGFHHLALSATRGHLVRAVLEGVAYNSRWLLKHVEAFVGHPFGAINVIGGGARSDLWCQILADVLGRPMRQVKDPLEANARGAAWIAAVGLGLADWRTLAQSCEIVREFVPSAATQALYQRCYREFAGLYRRNRAMHGRLQALVAGQRKAAETSSPLLEPALAGSGET